MAVSKEKAVPVIISEDETVLVGNKQEKRRIIKTISEYENELTLSDILKDEDIEGLPILVFSVAGKTKGGKSFLLNLMIKFLESKGEGNWLQGEVPKVFDWNGGIESTTRGLWIYPKIYRRSCSDGSEVGILLMDNEGLFDGEATDGEIIAMSGISTSISYVQMFNLKEKITSDHLESIVRHLVKGIEDLNLDQKKDVQQDHQLLFIIRDWFFEDDFDFGLEGGKNYIEYDKTRGTEELKKLWQMIGNSFRDVGCLLLPFPGTEVMKPRFKDRGNLTDLDKGFLNEIKKFIEEIFSEKKIKLPTYKLKGQDIYDILMGVNGKEADENLSWLNIFTEHGNSMKVHQMLERFRFRLESIKVDDLSCAKELMTSTLKSARIVLQGKSAPQHFEDLKKELEFIMNYRVIKSVVEKYKYHMTGEESPCSMMKTSEKHKYIWPNTQQKLSEFLCGDNDVCTEAMKKALKEIAAVYYEQLRIELIKQFPSECDKKNLEALAGFDEYVSKYRFVKCEDFGKKVADHDLFHPIWLLNQQYLKRDLSAAVQKRVGELTKITQEKLKSLKKKQYEHFESLTLLNDDEDGWDKIPKNEQELLHKKIGYGMFGLPSESETQKEYSSSQMKIIKQVSQKIVSVSALDPIRFSCIFITYCSPNKEEISSIPLFRIKTTETEVNYIDTNCRVYQDWIDFLQSNCLPDVVYCYPSHGSYNLNQGFSVAYAKPPSSTIKAKLVKGTDTAEKVVSGSAGVAAVAALALPVFGIAVAPAVGVFAIVGGGVAGAYGLGRNAWTIWNKRQHKQEVTCKDGWKLASNTLAVAGAGLGTVFRTGAYAAEKVTVGVVRVAQCVTGVNAVTVLFSNNDLPTVAELLNEIADNSLKFLFYFNTDSSKKAISKIRNALKMDIGARTEDVLEKLVSAKSIQVAVESENGAELKNYVSKGITDLVGSLMKVSRPTLRNVIMTVSEIEKIYKECKNEEMGPNGVNDAQRANTSWIFGSTNPKNKVGEEMGKKILKKMSIRLFMGVKKECERLQEKVTDLIFKQNTAFTTTESSPQTFGVEVIQQFLAIIEKPGEEQNMRPEGKQIMFVIRFLFNSIIGRIRQANQFYNTLPHEAINIPSYDVEWHLLEEITRRVRGLVEQNESSIDSIFAENPQLDCFIMKVLNLTFKCVNINYTHGHFVKYFLQITEEITKVFDCTLKDHQSEVKKNSKPTCSNVYSFFKKLKVEGNYGTWLMQQVLDKLDHFHPTPVESGGGISNTIISPAFPCVIDRLYCYYSSELIKQKSQLISEISTNRDVKFKTYIPVKGLCVCEPPDDSTPTYFIYSYEEDEECNIESGLIWCSGNNVQGQ